MDAKQVLKAIRLRANQLPKRDRARFLVSVRDRMEAEMFRRKPVSVAIEAAIRG